VMQAIADITGGGYYQALDRQQLQNAYKDISRLEPEDYETLSFRPRQSLFHYPLAIIIVGFTVFFLAMTWRERGRVKRLSTRQTDHG
ncbi:MAG: hypothetical protein ACC707_17345, partial [Thiohalomonadales bacterium]